MKDRKHQRGNAILGVIVASAIMVGTVFLAGSNLASITKVRRTIASREAYLDIERALITTVGMKMADYFSNPDNCSCKQGFVDSMNALRVGQSIGIRFLDDGRISELLTRPNLSAPQIAALNRARTNTTKLDGFMDDPKYQTADCHVKNNPGPNTSGYVPPSSLYLGIEFYHLAGTAAVPPDSVVDSDVSFAEVLFTMKNTTHSLAPSNCRAWPDQMMSPFMGGVSADIVATLYWNRKAAGNQPAIPLQHTVTFSIPVEQDPMWLYILRLYRDSLHREASFEEVWNKWQWYLGQKNAGRALTDIRNDLARGVIYSQEAGTTLIKDWGYRKWLGTSLGFGSTCTGDLVSHRAAIDHVNPSPLSDPCGDYGISGTDLYDKWDYALVFGQDFGGGKFVWAQNGGLDCQGDTTGNIVASTRPACDAACNTTVAQMFEILMNRAPTASEAASYLYKCQQGPWFLPQGKPRDALWLAGGSQLMDSGVEIAKTTDASEVAITQLFEQYLKRAPSNQELQTYARDQLSGTGSGRRLLDIATELAAGNEYYNLRP